MTRRCYEGPHDLHPPHPVLLAYTATCFVLFITPRPDMSLFLAKTVTGGRRAGLAAMLGAQAGCCVQTAFFVLKMGRLALSPVARDRRDPPRLGAEPQERRQARGLGLAHLPPGARREPDESEDCALFRDLPAPIVDAADPYARQKLVFLGVYFILFTLPLCALLVMGAERVMAVLKTKPRVMRGIDYTFAGIFGAFAVKILATPSR
jgi:threonine/homoserine/homoserine lactone efflux protein